MAEPKVSVLLQLIDKLSQPLEGIRGQLAKSGASFKQLGKEAMDLLNNKLIQGVGLFSMGQALNKAFDASDRLTASIRKLEGTAKITGVPLALLEDIAGRAKDEFGLSAVQAGDFATEMAKLATKAGDVGKAGPALEAFLDIGAARGLTAEQTLKAVQQAILGIDEGTDKLFNANPSVLYERFAESIGTTAGKLTDQQKAQALLTAATEDGGRVQGEYQKFLGSTAGQLQVTRTATEEAFATLGFALEGARNSFVRVLGYLVTKSQEFVGGIQIMGAGISAFLLGIPAGLTSVMGAALLNLGKLISVAEKIPVIGEKFEGVADSLQATGERMQSESRQALENIKAGYEAVSLDIVAAVERKGQRLTDAERQAMIDQFNAQQAGAKQQLAGAAAAAKEGEKITAASHKALEKLEDVANKGALAMLSAHQREWMELERKFRDEMERMTAADRQKAERLLETAHRNQLLAWAGFDKVLQPVVKQTMATPLKGFAEVADAAEDTGQRVEDSVVRWHRLRSEAAEVGSAIGKGAEQILRFGRDIGATNPQLEALVGGIGRLSEGIGGIAGGNLIGGLTSGILGLQGIVGSLFGNSPAEQARKALLQRNTDALARLRTGLGDFLQATTPGGKLAKLQGAGVMTALGGFTGGPDSGPAAGLRFSAFRSILAGQGLTIGEAEELFKSQTGGSLGIENERISGTAVGQFLQMLRDSEFNQFDQSFGGQVDFIERMARVTGSNDPAARLQAIVGELGGTNGNAFLANLLGGADLTSASGRASVRGQFGGILQSINSGTFDIAALDKFTGAEFVDLLEMLTDLFTQIDGATGTSVAPVTFTAPTLSAGVLGSSSDGGTVATAIARNTELSATELTRIRELIESGNLGAITIGTIQSTADVAGIDARLAALNEALQVERDLSDLSTGG